MCTTVVVGDDVSSQMRAPGNFIGVSHRSSFLFETAIGGEICIQDLYAAYFLNEHSCASTKRRSSNHPNHPPQSKYRQRLSTLQTSSRSLIDYSSSRQRQRKRQNMISTRWVQLERQDVKRCVASYIRMYTHAPATCTICLPPIGACGRARSVGSTHRPRSRHPLFPRS